MKKEKLIFKSKNKVKDTYCITQKGITLIAFAISRKCVRYEERA